MLTNRRTFIGALLWLVPFVASGQDASSAPLRVLFIGNSYTSVNDLPAMVAGLADSTDGRKIEVDRHLVGGCTLERHVKEKKAIDKIHAEKWDAVVLQEQSLRPVLDRQSMHEYARLLDAEIKQQGAKTVFYLTWARQHIPDMQEGADPATSPDYARAMYQIGKAGKTTEFDAWCQQQNDDRYYMTYSANHTGFPHYGIGYATADEPLGPWTKTDENPIAATDLAIGVSGPGHSCLTLSPDGKETFIVYHTHADHEKPSGDRVVNIDRIGFDESGKLRITGPTRSPQAIPSGCR